MTTVLDIYYKGRRMVYRPVAGPTGKPDPERRSETRHLEIDDHDHSHLTQAGNTPEEWAEAAKKVIDNPVPSL